MKKLIVVLFLISFLLPVTTNAFLATHGSQVLVEFDHYSTALDMNNKVCTKMFRLWEKSLLADNVNNDSSTYEGFYKLITDFINANKITKIIYSYNSNGELDNVVIFYIK